MLLIEKQYLVRFCALVYIHDIVGNVHNLPFFTQYYVFKISPC